LSDLIKKKRGGQPGNSNARTHGFYSDKFSLEQKRQMEYLTGVEGIDTALAVIRIKFSSVINTNPDNPKVLSLTAKMLANELMKKYHYPASRLRGLRKECYRFVSQNLPKNSQNQLNESASLSQHQVSF